MDTGTPGAALPEDATAASAVAAPAPAPVRDLARLLATGERAAFHGPPAAALDSLHEAIRLAHEQSRFAEATAAAWLLGVALAASGRFGSALRVLDPLADPASRGAAGTDGAELRLFTGLAAATIASAHRQLGAHDVAREFDLRGLAASDGLDTATFDCRLGLASDAIGVGDVATADAELATALQLAERHSDWWRQRVRSDWTRAEIAMLRGDPELAADIASEAVDRAELSRAPRHVAKGLLFMGIAQAQAGDSACTATLRRAATLAEQLGAVPLIWPARAMLGALVGESDPVESARCLQAARAAVVAIAGDLDGAVRQAWFGRPDIEALLSA